MKRSLHCLYALCFAIVAAGSTHAQTTNVDVLLSEAEVFAFEAPGKALKLAEYAIKTAETPEILAKACLVKAKTYKALGRYDLAMEEAFKACQLALELDQNLAIETQLFAFHLLQTLDISIAPSHFPALIDLQNPEFGSTLPDPLHSAVALTLGRHSMRRGDASAALNYFNQAEALTLGIEPASFGFGEPMVELALAYIDQGQEKLALDFLDKAEKRHLTYGGTSIHRAQILYERARVYYSQGEHTLALKDLTVAQSILDDSENLEIRTKIQHAFIDIFRVLDDGPQTNQAVQALYAASGEFEEVKNAALNSGHTGLSNFLEASSLQVQAKQNYSLAVVLLFLGAAVLIGLLIGTSNRVRSSNLRDIIKYLKSSRSVAQTKKDEAREQPLHRTTSVSKSAEEQLTQKLEEFEKGGGYLSQDMSLAKLASLLETNTKYLSEVINQQKGKNFNTYINELRVSYIIDKLKNNPIYRNYKVSYLAEECGFSSHSSFTTVFKSISGISPAKFIALVELEAQNKLEPKLA